LKSGAYKAGWPGLRSIPMTLCYRQSLLATLSYQPTWQLGYKSAVGGKGQIDIRHGLDPTTYHVPKSMAQIPVPAPTSNACRGSWSGAKCSRLYVKFKMWFWRSSLSLAKVSNLSGLHRLTESIGFSLWTDTVCQFCITQTGQGHATDLVIRKDVLAILVSWSNSQELVGKQSRVLGY